MSLEFPNQNRSFEPSKNRIRFWGYDGALEITFFVEGAALMKISPDAGLSETALLDAFDTMLEHIHHVARKVYKRSHESVCVLSETAF